MLSVLSGNFQCNYNMMLMRPRARGAMDFHNIIRVYAAYVHMAHYRCALCMEYNDHMYAWQHDVTNLCIL
jgi:hypothetical protein